MKVAWPSLVLGLLIPVLVLSASSAGTPRALLDPRQPVRITQVPGTEHPIYGPNNITTQDSPLLIALIWTGALGTIGTVIAIFIRFRSKHDEHPEFDDHLPDETRARGLQTFIQMTTNVKEEQD